MTVYKMMEIVGTSGTSLSDAITGALQRARNTGEDVQWFEVTEIRGRLNKGGPEFQVKVDVGYTLRVSEEEQLQSVARGRPASREATTRRTRSERAQVAAKKGQKHQDRMARGFEKQGR